MTTGGTPHVGACIGDFRLDCRLGSGAFKTVFSAVNTAKDNGYPERVAVCLPHERDEEARDILKNEFKVVRHLDHPSIVKAYGIEQADGFGFVVMELVEGRPLSEILEKQGAFSLPEAVETVRQIGEALDYAHDNLAIHRDIKPDNIIQGNDGIVKILDFGVARLLDHSRQKASTRIGALSYMAPEQFEGAYGFNADLWSLGVTFFQLISNTLPFMSKTEANLVKQICYEEPDLAPIEDLDLNPRLVGIFKRILEKDPEKRYARASEFLKDLDAIQRSGFASGKTEGEIEVLLRAHFPLVFIATHEEDRALRSLAKIRDSMSRDKEIDLLVWRETYGLTDGQGRVVSRETSGDPVVALGEICRSAREGIYVFLDIHPHLSPVVVRMIRDSIWTVKRQRKSLVFISPAAALPPELEADATLVYFDLPDAEELTELIEKIGGEFGAESPEGELRNNLCRAVKGLALREAERVLRRSLIRNNGFNPKCLEDAMVQKKQLVRRGGRLEYWERGNDFSGAGHRFGLRPSKGVVLLGIPGCGKSLSAKALAAEWNVPLLRLDMGKIYSSLLGESEANLRQSLSVAAAASPCVLWIDEMEKAFSGMSEGGVSARIFGAFLVWLEERQAPVFVVATANDIQGLPPEMTRKGRFDEVFFVGLPDESQRKEIFSIHIAKRKRKPENFDLDELARISEGYSGAEIEEAIVSGLYLAFEEDARELTTGDIAGSLKEAPPLSASKSAGIGRMAQWARQNARAA